MAKISGQSMTMPDGATRCFLATMTWRQLVDLAKVDAWQHFEVDGVVSAAGELPHGYQRPEQQAQINQMKEGLESGGWFFGAIVGNIRDTTKIKVKGGSMEIEDGTPMYLMDGQQRTAAIRAFLRKHPNFGCRKVIVQVFYGNDALFEGKAFMLMNIGKTVPSDLRQRLVAHFSYIERRQMLIGKMPGISPRLGIRLVKEAQAIDILNSLRGLRSPLYDYIRKPNENNAGIPLKQNSFVRSLIESGLFECKAIFGDAIDGIPNKQAEIIDTYWKAIEQVWPQPFDEKGLTSGHRKYSLISAVCFIALHTLLAEMLKVWEGEFTVERVAAILNRAKGNLNVEFWTKLHPKDPMIGNGVEFWSSYNPMIRHKGNSEVRKELYGHVCEAICGDASLECVVRETLRR